MAPEIKRLKGKEESYTFACDMWSIGVIAYYLYTGKFPFRYDYATSG